MLAGPRYGAVRFRLAVMTGGQTGRDRCPPVMTPKARFSNIVDRFSQPCRKEALMSDSEYTRDADRVPPRSMQTRLEKVPLVRRTFVGWLALGMSFGLSGVARGSQVVNQQADSQATPAAGSGARTLGLGIIGLHVADLGASLAFYRRIGLDIPTDVDLGGGAFRLPLPNGQIFFWETIAYTQRYFEGYELGTGQRKVSLEFGFRTPEEVDEMYNALIADGYGSYKEPLSWGSIRYAGVLDPDDNQIALRFPLAS